MKKAIKDYLAKLHDNKKDKGFSLVELIIVIAIMAILVGVVASQVLPYIEKSRKSKDQEALSNVSTEMITAISDALADGSVAEDEFTFTVTSTGVSGVTANSFGELVLKKYGATKNVASSGDASGLTAVASAADDESTGGTTADAKTVGENSLKSVAEGLKSKASNGQFKIVYTKSTDTPPKREIAINGGDGSDSAVCVKGSLN